MGRFNQSLILIIISQLEKILLNKKFFKLIKEYAVIFSEFFETFLHFSNLAILYYMYIFSTTFNK